jgi:hypothetical protein
MSDNNVKYCKQTTYVSISAFKKQVFFSADGSGIPSLLASLNPSLMRATLQRRRARTRLAQARKPWVSFVSCTMPHQGILPISLFFKCDFFLENRGPQAPSPATTDQLRQHLQSSNHQSTSPTRPAIPSRSTIKFLITFTSSSAQARELLRCSIRAITAPLCAHGRTTMLSLQQIKRRLGATTG